MDEVDVADVRLDEVDVDVVPRLDVVATVAAAVVLLVLCVDVLLTLVVVVVMCVDDAVDEGAVDTVDLVWEVVTVRPPILVDVMDTNICAEMDVNV